VRTALRSDRVVVSITRAKAWALGQFSASRNSSGFGSDSGAQIWVDARVGQDVHAAAEEYFEILLETDEVEKGSVVSHLDQEIDVALRPVVTACDGTEYAHVPRGDAQDLFAVPVNRHGWRPEAL